MAHDLLVTLLFVLVGVVVYLALVDDAEDRFGSRSLVLYVLVAIVVLLFVLAL